MDIENDLETRPVAKQFRKSLIKYMQSADFTPQTEVKPAVITALFDKTKPEVKVSLQVLPTEG